MRLGGAGTVPGPARGAGQAAAPRPGGLAARPVLAVPRAVAAGRARPVRRRGAGRRDHHRRRPDLRARVRDRGQRRHGQGRHLLPDDGQEAPAGPGGGPAQPAAVRLPGRLGRRLTCPPRTRCSPTASTSAGSSTTRPPCPAGHPADRRGAGLVHRRRRLRAGHERRDGDRPQPGHDLPGRPAAGEGGHRRGRHRRGARRRRRCTPGSPGSPTTWPTTTRTRCASSAPSSPPSARAPPGRGRSSRPRSRRPTRTSSTTSSRPTPGPPTTCAR